MHFLKMPICHIVLIPVVVLHPQVASALIPNLPLGTFFQQRPIFSPNHPRKMGLKLNKDLKYKKIIKQYLECQLLPIFVQSPPTRSWLD